MQLTGIHSYAIDPNHTQNYAVTYDSDSEDLPFTCENGINNAHAITLHY